MKNKVFTTVFLAVILVLGMTGISFARGGMGGGISGSRGTFGGHAGASFERGSFHSSSQGMSGPSGRYQQEHDRNRGGIQDRSQDQDRSRDHQIRDDRNPGETGGPVAGNPRGRDDFRGGDNGNHYGEQKIVNNGQGENHRATPATPAQPGLSGEGATPAIPATPAGK